MTYKKVAVSVEESPTIIEKAKSERLCRVLLPWFRDNGRDFPWRRTRDPYQILVAEMCLQKTNADKVVPAFEKIMSDYPQITLLSKANRDDLNQHFSYLGLFKRGDFLLGIAKTIMERHGGVIPRDREALLSIKGIGEYTANSILCLAYGERLPLLDGSTQRVLCRVFDKLADKPAWANKRMRGFMQAVLPADEAREFNLALIDIAASYCRPKNPKCSDCPIAGVCSAAHKRKVSELDSASEHYRFIDLFAGIGGMRIPFERLGCECVFSSDWDSDAQDTYAANFDERPFGDITKIEESLIPDHDILLAGFPCQAFSIMGDMNGFYDTRGTLFFDIVRILAAKKPRAFLLENVKNLASHDKHRTLKIILLELKKLGYYTHWKVLNALDFGLSHKRERVFIVGFQENYLFRFPIYSGPRKTLSDILEPDVPPEYYASERIRRKRKASHTPNCNPSIWHENKAGHISSYPYSCALRANASHNYLLVNGERHLTPREMLRLLGFPDSFKIVCGYSQMRKLAGNSVCVPVVEAIAREMLRCLSGKVLLVNEEPLYPAEQLRLLKISEVSN